MQVGDNLLCRLKKMFFKPFPAVACGSLQTLRKGVWIANNHKIAEYLKSPLGSVFVDVFFPDVFCGLEDCGYLFIGYFFVHVYAADAC